MKLITITKMDFFANLYLYISGPRTGKMAGKAMHTPQATTQPRSNKIY